MSTIDERGRDLLASVWRDIQAASQRNELERVKADPRKHRLTRIMKPGAHTGFTFWPAGEVKGKRKKERTSFCVSTHRNAAGVFLIWRQVETFRLKRGRWHWDQTARFDFQWADTKKDARDLAGRKAKRHRDELARKAVAKLPNAPAEVQVMFASAIA